MKVVKELTDWMYSILIAFSIAVIVNAFIFQPTRVQGSSMEPTLHENNYLFVSKLSHTFHKNPEYGDIVIIDSRVFRERSWKDDIADPLKTYLSLAGITPESDYLWVKRVVGKPGDVLEFLDGKVYRNGKQLDEPYIKEAMQPTFDKKVVIPQNHVFVMGDNRNNSCDSRYIGTVPLNNVLGNVAAKL